MEATSTRTNSVVEVTNSQGKVGFVAIARNHHSVSSDDIQNEEIEISSPPSYATHSVRLVAFLS